MGLKSFIAKQAANFIVPGIYKEHQNGVETQFKVFKELLSNLKRTSYGKDNSAGKIKSIKDFQAQIPLVDYEDIKGYIERIAEGEEDVLFPGKPECFCKSSGTTSGTKYIPLTKQSLAEQIRAARNALLMYIWQGGSPAFFDYKMIFLQGSPILDTHGKVASGRLSGIVYHHVPAYLNKNRLPSYKTNCIEDWEDKVSAIAEETLKERMSLISGIPPWVVMYFEILLKKTGKKNIKEIFPDFSLFAYGGVNYEPYRKRIEDLIGFKIDTVETYPASEGFIAFSETPNDPGMLLNLNGGIFYEFVKVDDFLSGNLNRITIAEVELGINYALVLNTNAGLWGYVIGDTVKFTSIKPYKIIVSGRIKHFISAFGEHVIAEEVEFAMQKACELTGAEISEFTVAPFISDDKTKSYHQWLVEFHKEPNSICDFARIADENLQNQNSYYFDLRDGRMLSCLEIVCLQKGTFQEYMKSIGKLGGQNKVPRLTNTREIADKLIQFG